MLQAIHMAISCAQRATELQQQVIAQSSLRYCPTGDFQNLGNSGPYENRKGGSRGIIDFDGKTSEQLPANYRVEIYKARNFSNIGVDRSGVLPGFGQFICDPTNLFSIYVPGLAGIPHHEEMRSYSSVFLKAAGGEANLVFRNIIRLIHERGKLEELESMLFDVVGPCKFQLNFNGDKDLYVDVKLSFDEHGAEHTFVPVDLSGTGVLQITQILAYVILFGPKILLVDEPDSHLHPSRQALLSSAFERIVEKYKCRIIVSTHSRHLISSAPNDTTLVWLRNGSVESQDNKLAEILLDLGALDQIDSSGAETIICTEDRGKVHLEKCVDRTGKSGSVKVISYNGVTNSSSAAVIKSMAELFSRVPEIIIHRDRDFLTDEELEKWSAEFLNRGMRVFCPELPDIESYYVTSSHLKKIYADHSSEIDALIAAIRETHRLEFRKKFREKRRQAVLDFWRDGGGPAIDTLWPENDPARTRNVLGKMMVSKVNEACSKNFEQRKNIFSIPSTKLTRELDDFLERKNAQN